MCRRCGAEPGRQCTSASGNFATVPHRERYDDAREVFGVASSQHEAKEPRELRIARDRRRRATRREHLKQRVFSHYGTSCACCSATENLSIDHINGGGEQHRKEIGRSGLQFYAWLVKNNFPTGFQTLCMLCNTSKFTSDRCRIHDPICPTCHRPLEDGMVLASRNSRAFSNFVAIPAPTKPAA